VLALQEEFRVSSLARSGSEAVLGELSGLLTRFGVLVKRKGTASEVSTRVSPKRRKFVYVCVLGLTLTPSYSGCWESSLDC